jgi:DNA-binding XRE family transcriptional regulator
MYLDGKTLTVIGRKYKISRERVRQILTKHYGIRAPDGGMSLSVKRWRDVLDAQHNARSFKLWGCSYAEYKRILKHPGKPTRAYWNQRRNEKERGIGWDFNLWQWWKVWEQSGHWDERGRGGGYCMCRLNDTGPYSVDNVYIATGIENMRDYWVNRHGASQGLADGFIERVESCLRNRGMTASGLGRAALNDPHFVEKLRAGSIPGPQTIARVEQFVASMQNVPVRQRRPQHPLEVWRNSLNLTQPSAARHLGVSLNTLSGWECGHHVPNRKHLTSISEKTGVTLACRPQPTPEPALDRAAS